MSRCNTCWMDGGPTLATPGSPIRGSFDTDEGLLMGDSPLQDALFALGNGSAFDSTGLFIRDKLFTEGCELELRFEDDSNSDGATADRILMSPSDAYVEGGHCSGDSRISHVNSMLELPEEKNKYHMDRRLHSSCQSFIDIGLQQDDNDGILPGATDIVLLDTDEEYQHAPLEGFSGDSDSSNSTAAALDLKRIISVASFSVPTLDGSNAHFHAPLLSSRTVSPSVTHASDSIQNAFSMQPVAAMQTATGFFSSLKPAKCMAADAASGRPRRVTATAFDVAEVVECPLKVGKKRGSGAQAGKLTANPNGHACTACGALTTPVWRAGPHGPKTLCNACGVRYMKVAKRK